MSPLSAFFAVVLSAHAWAQGPRARVSSFAQFADVLSRHEAFAELDGPAQAAALQQGHRILRELGGPAELSIDPQGREIALAPDSGEPRLIRLLDPERGETAEIRELAQALARGAAPAELEGALDRLFEDRASLAGPPAGAVFAADRPGSVPKVRLAPPAPELWKDPRFVERHVFEAARHLSQRPDAWLPLFSSVWFDSFRMAKLLVIGLSLALLWTDLALGSLNALYLWKARFRVRIWEQSDAAGPREIVKAALESGWEPPRS